MKDQIQNQIIKAVAICSVILLVSMQSSSTYAQGFKNFAREYQLGFEGAFGVKQFTLHSNIDKINNLKVAEEGGTIGIVMGAKALRVKVRQGYFYSSSSVAQTVDEIRSAFIGNLYPLKIAGPNNSKIQPYLMGGVERNIFKMYGTYGPEETTTINYSVSEAPFLGKISSIVASVGAGAEYKVESPGHFLTLFAEGRFGKTLTTKASNNFFQQTSISDQLMINIGVTFGYRK